MSDKNPDLHGNVPDKAGVALLLIDVINDLEFPGGDKLLPQALEMAGHLDQLSQRARRHRIPVIYVNDNFGRWQENFRQIIDHCLNDEVRGAPVAEKLQPKKNDYFVLKPKHSGFFSTTLDTLLRYLGAEILILTGLTADNCVLFTANDAYMRDYRLIIPGDCVASIDPRDNCHMLKFMQKTLKADITASGKLDLTRLTV
jgi:nicotinamidase-related amidase